MDASARRRSARLARGPSAPQQPSPPVTAASSADASEEGLLPPLVENLNLDSTSTSRSAATATATPISALGEHGASVVAGRKRRRTNSREEAEEEEEEERRRHSADGEEEEKKDKVGREERGEGSAVEEDAGDKEGEAKAEKERNGEKKKKKEEDGQAAEVVVVVSDDDDADQGPKQRVQSRRAGRLSLRRQAKKESPGEPLREGDVEGQRYKNTDTEQSVSTLTEKLDAVTANAYAPASAAESGQSAKQQRAPRQETENDNTEKGETKDGISTLHGGANGKTLSADDGQAATEHHEVTPENEGQKLVQVTSPTSSINKNRKRSKRETLSLLDGSYWSIPPTDSPTKQEEPRRPLSRSSSRKHLFPTSPPNAELDNLKIEATQTSQSETMEVDNTQTTVPTSCETITMESIVPHEVSSNHQTSADMAPTVAEGKELQVEDNTIGLQDLAPVSTQAGVQSTENSEENEEGIWQRVKQRRKHGKQHGSQSTLFEPSLPISFSSVSLYSAHSSVPLPIISPLRKRLKTRDEEEEEITGTINAGKKAELGCWRRPSRSIPSPISAKVRRRLALSGAQDPFTVDDSDKLGLWYVLATEDDPDPAYHPIDNYSIYRRYEITLAQWERLGKRWNGHVDTHADFLHNLELRDRRGRSGMPTALKRTSITAGTDEGDNSEIEDDARDIKEAESDDDFGDGESRGRKSKRARSSSGTTQSHSSGQIEYPVPTKKPSMDANCHHCKVKKQYWLACPVEPKHRFCHRCAFKHFQLWYDDAFPSGGGAWDQGCPICRRECPCAACRKRNPLEIKAEAKEKRLSVDDLTMNSDKGARADTDFQEDKSVLSAKEDEQNDSEKEGDVDILNISDESGADEKNEAPHSKDVREVERVVHCRVNSSGNKEYLVQWKESWIDFNDTQEQKYKQAVESIVATETKRSGHKSIKRSLIRWKDSWELAECLPPECLQSLEMQKLEQAETHPSTASDQPVDNNLPTIKRRRGRPPKPKVPNLVQNKGEEAPKRKRGRPRKYPKAEAQDPNIYPSGADHIPQSEEPKSSHHATEEDAAKETNTGTNSGMLIQRNPYEPCRGRNRFFIRSNDSNRIKPWVLPLESLAENF